MPAPSQSQILLQERWELLAQATGDLFYDLDCATQSLDWGASLSAFGYPPDLSITSWTWWAERIHPEDAPEALRAREAALREAGAHYRAEYRFQMANGSYRYIRDRGAVQRDAEGQPLRLVGHMEDVHLHQQMFLHNAQPMWVFHRESLQFLEVNDAAVRVYGYTREEFARMFLTDIRPVEDRQLLLETVRSPARGHEGHRVWRHLTKAGEQLLVEVRTQDLEWRGQPARMAILTDVTNRVAVEEKLRAHEKIEAAGLIASGLAHDFNNLLTVINAQAERLERNFESLSEGERQAAISMIRQAGERSAQWTRRLMDFARGRPSQPESFAPGPLIEGLAPFLERLLPQNLRLELDLEGVNARLHADPSQLEQILLNLTWNAAAACEATPATLRIRLAEDLKTAPAEIRISVEDTGPGMPESVARRAFEPLFSGRKDSSGAGLGLANVERLVKGMGGSIALHSIPGAGSRFDLRFPAAPVAVAIEALPQSQAKVLLVDDDPMMRESLRAALQGAGHSVVEAVNGRDAYQVLLSTPVDLLVTDLVMPEREGLELIQQVRASHADLPIVAISGAFDGRFLLLAQTFGASAALPKPFPIDRLLRTVQTILERRREGATPPL